MPQVQLPIFPPGVTPINETLAFEKREGKVYYFNGFLPVFHHDEKDLGAFRLFTSQLTVGGGASQAEISRSFGVPKITVKRYAKLYRQEGAKAFFAPRPRRGGSRLTAQVLARAQALLDQGRSVPEIGSELQVLPNTLHKAIGDGRLRRPPPKKKTRDFLKAILRGRLESGRKGNWSPIPSSRASEL